MKGSLVLEEQETMRVAVTVPVTLITCSFLNIAGDQITIIVMVNKHTLEITLKTILGKAEAFYWT